MSQVAQQDHLFVDIKLPLHLTADEKKEILNHIKRGTIWDILFHMVEDGFTSRPVYVTDDFSSVGYIDQTDDKVHYLELID